jgi:serine/threonine-protein kinase SRPK3
MLRCLQLRLASSSLFLRPNKFTLSPANTRQLLRPDRLYCTTSGTRPQGVSPKPLETVTPFEEERLPEYEAEQFYPVDIGDTIISRYNVIGKLGYGANSTVWFCRDLLYDHKRSGSAQVEPADSSAEHDKYVVLKLYVRTPPGRVNRETSFYNHVHTLYTAHPGSQRIRHVIDQFSLVRTSGDVHECLLHRPLQTTLFSFQRPGGIPRPFPEELAKSIMRDLLEALDFLHREANVTHCGTRPTTIRETKALTLLTQI